MRQKKLQFYNDDGWFFVGSKNPPSRQLLDPISKETVNVYDKGRFSLLFKGPEIYTKEKFTRLIQVFLTVGQT